MFNYISSLLAYKQTHTSDKNHECKECRKISNIIHTFLYIRELIELRNPMNVMCAEKTSTRSQTSIGFREFLQMKNTINVINVEKLSFTSHPLLCTRKGTQVRIL
jgi:hypothetical protein